MTKQGEDKSIKHTFIYIYSIYIYTVYCIYNKETEITLYRLCLFKKKKSNDERDGISFGDW